MASEEFTDAADIQAKALGMNNAKAVFVRHPIQDATDDEMRGKADDTVKAVIEALT